MSEADNEVLIGDGEELDLNLSASTILEDEYRASVPKTLSAGSRSRYRSGSQRQTLPLGHRIYSDPDPSPWTPPGQTLPLGHRIVTDPVPSPCTPPGQTLPLGHSLVTDPDPSIPCPGTLPPLTHPPLRAPHHRADSPTCFHPIPSEMLLRLKPPCQSPGCPADVFLTPVKTSTISVPGNLILMTQAVLRRQPTSLYPKSRWKVIQDIICAQFINWHRSRKMGMVNVTNVWCACQSINSSGPARQLTSTSRNMWRLSTLNNTRRIKSLWQKRVDTKENARPHPASPPARALRWTIPFQNGSRPLVVVAHLSCPSTVNKTTMRTQW